MTKILIIDDEESAELLYGPPLKESGHEVLFAHNGVEGLEVFSKEKPELIITDIKMPMMDGFKLLEKVKSQSKETEVIVLTGFSDIESASKAIRRGACDYVVKPIYRDKLKLCVEAAIKKIELTKKYNQSQAELNHQTKLALIGTLAASIIHELSTPIVIADGSAKKIKKLSEDNPEIVRKAEMIENATKRMKVVVDHLRSYVRKEETEEWSEFEISEPIKDSLIFLGPDLRHGNIEINFDFAEESSTILGEKVAIESIFQNLIMNSKFAFSEVDDERAKKIEITTASEGEGIKIVYKDNASGMPEEVVDKIFNPFFTTKKDGEGTGLGMSILSDIVKKHGGTISVDSKIGEGTTFEIFLPSKCEGALSKSA